MKAALVALALLAATPALACTPPGPFYYQFDTATCLGVDVNPADGVLTTNDRTINWSYVGALSFNWIPDGPTRLTSRSSDLELAINFLSPLVITQQPIALETISIRLISNLPDTGVYGGDGVNWNLAPPELSGFVRHTDLTAMPNLFGGVNVPINSFYADYAYQYGTEPINITGYSISITAVVPEPSTWALLLFGFAFLGVRQFWPGASHG